MSGTSMAAPMVTGVAAMLYSYRTDLEQIKAMNPKGIILTGGPNSCYEGDSPTYTKELFELGIPDYMGRLLWGGSL